MATKFVSFSPAPLPSYKHPTTSGKSSIGSFDVLFPTARNPTSLSVFQAHAIGYGVSSNRLRRMWALEAFPSTGKSSSDKWEEEGLILESLPNGKFLVQLSNGESIFGYLSGKIRQRFIRVMPGDRVKLEFSRYDMSKCRITYRLRKDRLPEAEE